MNKFEGEYLNKAVEKQQGICELANYRISELIGNYRIHELANYPENYRISELTN